MQAVDDDKETDNCPRKTNDINYLQIYLFTPQNLLVHFPPQDSRRYVSPFQWG